MKIETKYDIGQEVFHLLDTVKKDKVRDIIINVDKHGYCVEYVFENYTSKKSEVNVFATKEELIKSL